MASHLQMGGTMATTLNHVNLDEIRARLKPFQEQEERARQMSATVPPAAVFVGILGPPLPCDAFSFLEGYGSIRKVTNPPGLVHVCSAADPRRSDYMGVSRYSHALTSEIAFGNTQEFSARRDLQMLLELAWHTVAMLKLRTGAAFVCPAASSCSWDTVAAAPKGTVHFDLLDDVSREVLASPQRRAISVDDLNWVKQHWSIALELRDAQSSGRFGLAFNLMYTWNHVTDPRLAITNLWCGLEALFGTNEKSLSSKLAARISQWVPSASKQKVRKLYGIRCNAVHGARLDNAQVANAAEETEDVLRKALIRCIETNSKTLPDWK
jgi:hypothetical protein